MAGFVDTIGPDGRRRPAGFKLPKNGKGYRYQARWRSPDGKSRKATFDRKLDAERHLAKQTIDKAQGAYIDAAAARTRFGVVAERWAAGQPHRGTTAQSVRSILDVHVLPTFADRPIGQIAASEVQGWVSGLALAPRTAQVTYGKVAAIFRSAVLDRLIPFSPCGPHIKLPRQNGEKVTPMAPAEVAAIIEAAPEHYRALLVLIAGTGVRPGEALGLTRDRVDWLRRTIRIDRQLVTLAGEAPTLGPVKTKASVRTIPAPDDVLAVLGAHVQRWPVSDGGPMFRDEKGDPIRRNALGHMWRRAAAKVNAAAKGDDHVRLNDRTPHDLRHYAASDMIDRGLSVKAVQEQLGHASASTTLDTYAHLWPEAEDATRAALASGLDGVLGAHCVPAASEAMA